jgi:hypothetical protein
MTPQEDFFERLRQSLIESDVNPYRAWQVAQFVTHCYAILFSAHQALIQPNKWKQFCSTRGATNKRRRATIAPANISETAITAHLSKEAEHLLQGGGGAFAYVPSTAISSVVADLTSPSDTATGSSSKRPDLVFFPANPALRLQFAMEAKVIRIATGIANDLLGAEGFGCFVRAIDPYQTNGVVGLLGYVAPSEAVAMTNETTRCMQQDPRFAHVGLHELMVNTAGANHRPHTVMGHIVCAEPKVCIANMLAVDLTVSPSAE